MAENEGRPWDQREDESPKAFAAFVKFRDLGPTRKVSAVAKEPARPEGGPGEALEGPKKAPKSTPGVFKKWAKQHKWVERATAYDRFFAEASDRGKAKAIEQHQEDLLSTLMKAQEQEVLELMNLAKLLRKQGKYLVSFPAKEQVVEEGGRKVVFSPADPKTHLAGCKLIVESAEVMARAFALGKAICLPGVAPPVTEQDRSAEEVAATEQARRELMEWQKTIGDGLSSSGSARSAPPTSPTSTG